MVEDIYGCVGSDTILLKKILLPQTRIFSVTAISFCKAVATDSVKLMVSEGQNYVYEWFKNGASIGNNSPKLNFSQNLNSLSSNQYTAKITLGVCSSTSDVTNVSVNSCIGGGTGCVEPVVSFTVPNDCQPYDFVNTSSLTDNSVWNFGDGTSSSLASPTGKTYSKEGLYDVQLSRKCAYTSNKIEVPAEANFQKDSEGCSGTPIKFKDFSRALATTPITDWVWDFGDGNTNIGSGTGTRDIEHLYTNTGTYTVSLTVNALNSKAKVCTHTKTLQIEVRPSPIANFTVNIPACTDDLYTFTNTSSFETSTASSAWKLGDGDISTANNPAKRFIITGAKTIELTLTDLFGCSSIASKSITVTPKVVPQLLTKSANPIICNGNSLTLTSPASTGAYIWYKNGVLITGETAQNLVVNASGNYNVNYTNTSCSINSDTVAVINFSLPFP